MKRVVVVLYGIETRASGLESLCGRLRSRMAGSVEQSQQLWSPAFNIVSLPPSSPVRVSASSRFRIFPSRAPVVDHEHINHKVSRTRVLKISTIMSRPSLSECTTSFLSGVMRQKILHRQLSKERHLSVTTPHNSTKLFLNANVIS